MKGVPRRGRDVRDPGTLIEAGRRDKHVETAVGGDDGVHESSDVTGVGDVDDLGRATGQVGRCGLDASPVHVCEHHPSPLDCERLAQHEAEASGGASDKDDLALEPEPHDAAAPDDT